MDTVLSKALRDFMSGPLKQLIVNLAGQDGPTVEAELNKFNRREPCWTNGVVPEVDPQVPLVPRTRVAAPLTLLASNISVRASAECKVKDLFLGKHIAYRDGDLDKLLQKTVPAVAGGVSASFQLGVQMNFVEMSATHLGCTKDPDVLSKELVRGKKTFSVKQADDMLIECDRGENPFKLRTDGCANLIPVFDGASVFFLRVRRYLDGWRVYVGRLEDSDRCDAEGMVLFRN